MLPFHMAAVNQAPMDVLFYLACQNPEALLCTEHGQVIPDGQVGVKRKRSNI